MGVTIHYRFGQYKKLVPAMLDKVQAYSLLLKKEQAEKTDISFEVVRDHPYRLTVRIGGCEWLQLGFGSMKHWREQEGWSYEKETLEGAFVEYMLNREDLMWCSGFCKTQYASSVIEHKWVADILKMTASFCRFVEVYDEGDYYHTGNIEDASQSIEENGKMIADLGAMLAQNFSPDSIIKGGETKVKSRKSPI